MGKCQHYYLLDLLYGMSYNSIYYYSKLQLKFMKTNSINFKKIIERNTHAENIVRYALSTYFSIYEEENICSYIYKCYDIISLINEAIQFL